MEGCVYFTLTIWASILLTGSLNNLEQQKSTEILRMIEFNFELRPCYYIAKFCVVVLTSNMYLVEV